VPTVLVVADQLLSSWYRTEMTGCPAACAATVLGVDVLELRIAVGMLRALVGLAFDCRL